MSWALLVVLETLTPAERAAFVLHDVFGLSFADVGKAVGRSPAACRKLASRARAHVEQRQPRFDVDPSAHRMVVDAFVDATTTGDLQALLGVLDPGVVLTADGGGVVQALPKPIRGRTTVARFLTAVVARTPESTFRATVANGNSALLIARDGRLDAVVVLGITEGQISTIDFIRNPNKFNGLRLTRANGTNESEERSERHALGQEHHRRESRGRPSRSTEHKARR